MPGKQNSFTHLRVLLVLTDRGILDKVTGVAYYYYYYYYYHYYYHYYYYIIIILLFWTSQHFGETFAN